MNCCDWYDAGEHTWRAWENLRDARTLGSQAEAMIDLSNAMADLVTFLPGYDLETGGLREQEETSA